MTHRLEVKLDRAAESGGRLHPFHVCEKMQTETISEKIGEARVLNYVKQGHPLKLSIIRSLNLQVVYL
jgi:hypothetical protein